MAKLMSLCILFWLFLAHHIMAIELDINSQDSIKSAAADIAYGMMSYYKGNTSGQIPGLLPEPYYWWECGALMGAMVDYWHYTGDSTYNSVVSQALLFQVGPYNDYMPPNETFTMGNDDQAFWGMAALSAAETNFPNPPAGSPSWLSLAQAVYNEQIARWDTESCGGGIRWQVEPANGGYNLKNTIANGCLFNIASRLARYTNDDEYAQWAVKIWDWLYAIKLIDDDFNVFDNSDSNLNCSRVDHNQWSYNAGTMLIGAATLYNYTNGDALWENRTTGLLNRISQIYFPNGAMTDICEASNACNVDQHSFKAYLSRWMAATTQMAPYTYDTIIGLLRSSAEAAAAQCIGTVSGISVPSGQVCGLKWNQNGTWDGSNGVGQEMAAMEVILGTLIQQSQAPLTNSTGGTSASDPNAGHNSSAIPTTTQIMPTKKADKGAAWFLTSFILASGFCTIWFMLSSSGEREGPGGPTVGGIYKNGRSRSTLVKGKGREFDEKRVQGGVLGAVDEEQATNPRDIETIRFADRHLSMPPPARLRIHRHSRNATM